MSDATEQNPPNSYLHLDWRVPDPNYTVAHGESTSGWLEKGLNFRDSSGPKGCSGYFHTPGTDSVDTDDWGTLRLLQALEIVALVWSDSFPSPRIHYGDISRRYGGRFYDAQNPSLTDHSQHQKGIEVDVRYIRKKDANGNDELSLDLLNGSQKAYFDSLRTIWLISAFASLPDIYKIIVDPLVGLPASDLISVDAVKRDHSDHFHVWIRDPDGMN